MLASSMGHTGTGWLDLLMDEGQSLHGNGPERPLSEGGGKTSTDSSPENPPSAQPLISNQISLSQPSNCSSAVEVTQTLLRLQRELLEFRRASRSSTSSRPGSTPSNDQPSSSWQNSTNPVDAVLKPGQVLLDMIRRIFEEYYKTYHGLAHPSSFPDRATLLPLVVSPMSLLLSSYGEMLREIATALNQPQNMTSFFPGAQQRAAPSNSEHGIQAHTSTIPERLNLKFGDMSLDYPLQLILIATVINHQLAQLNRALQDYQGIHMRAPNMGISHDLFVATTAELKSATEELMAEAGKLLRQPRT